MRRTSAQGRGALAWWWLAVVLLLAACGGELAPRAPEQELRPMVDERSPDGMLDALLSRGPLEGAALLAAAAERPVRVIVQLAVGYRAESELASAAAVQSQRQAIEAAGGALLARLNLDAASGRRFQRFPYLSLAADQATLRALLADPAVARVVQDLPDRAQMAESNPLIGADTLWALGIDGGGYAVAVLDSGVEAGHPFFMDGAASAVVAQACFSSTWDGGPNETSYSACPAGNDPAGDDWQVGDGAGAPCDDAADDALRGTDQCHHGTHVAGTVGGRNGPVSNPSGVAPGVGIVAVQVFSYFPAADNPMCPSNCALTWTSDQMAALEWLLDLMEGAESAYPDFPDQHELVAANMSLGGGQYYTPCFDDPRRPVIRALKAANVATVVAAGNNGYSNSLAAPACIPEAVTIGATQDGSLGTTTDAWAPFSNANFMVDLAAPGQWTTSSIPGGGYETYSGTSMAAPHVAGAWALLREAHPGVSVDEALDRLQATGTAVTDIGGVPQTRINVDLAVATDRPAVLVDRPLAAGGPSYATGAYYTDIDLGEYAAVDFQFSADQQIGFIGVTGWNHPTLASSWPRNLTHFDWFLYEDDGGQPAGHPEDGLGLHLWHLRLASDHPAITRRGLELQLDLDQAGGPLPLAAGRYWLLLFSSTDRAAGSLDDGDRWLWYAAPQDLDIDKYIVPTGVPASWTDIPPTGPDLTDRAFRLLGQAAAPDPAVLSVSVGLGQSSVDAGGSTQATATVVAVGGASTAVSWSSSDSARATVDASGLVTAVAPGTVDITATSVFDPSRSGSASLTVTLPPATRADIAFGGNTISHRSAQLGDDDVPVLATVATVPDDSRDVRLDGAQLRVTVQGLAAGSPVDSSVLERVNVYHDANGNGRVDAGDTLLGSSDAFAADGSVPLTFGTALEIAAGGSEGLLVTYDLASASASAASAWWAALLLLPPSLLLFRGGRRRLALLLASMALLLAACGGGGPSNVLRYSVQLREVTAVSVPAGLTPSVTGTPVQGAMVSFPRP